MKACSKGRVACAVLVAAVAGFGVASAAGASGTPWITHTSTAAGAPTSRSATSLPQGAFYIYDNFRPGNAYNSSTGWTVSGSSSGTGQQFTSAMSFTPTSNAQVTQIDLGLTHVSGWNTATVQLARDSGGIPGTVLGTWTVSGQPSYPSCCGVTTFSTGLIAVGAGRKYWVVVSAINGSDTEDAWNWNTTGATGGDFYDGTTWYMYGNPTGAFDVIGCGKVCRVA